MSSGIPIQPPGQPQSKAAPIAQLTVPAAAQSDDEVPAKPVEPPRPRSVRPVKEPKSTDASLLPSTLSLIQRVLTPDRNAVTHTDPSAIEDILPPLTSSNDVDIELYAILAIIVKDFVNTWYSKITPDHGFVEEIVQIVAHCSRALEQRLRKVDTAALLLDEVPLLVQAHVEAYRTAKSISVTSPYHPTIRRIYHELSPHPALSPLPSDYDPPTFIQQEQNERTYRQLLIQGSLAILLPTEDLQNGPLRVLVGDIIADLIVGQALAEKVCEGWFLHDAIFKVATILDDKLRPKATGSELRDDAKNRLEKFGLLASESEAQRYHSSTNGQSQIAAFFWRFMQYGYLMYLFLRYLLGEIQTVRRKPRRHQVARVSTSSPVLSEDDKLRTPTQGDSPPRPVLAFGVYTMLSTLLRLADRMPWVASMLAFLQHVLLVGLGRVGELNSILDR
ncbi:hypothetical protein OHC33_004048 [Knufia fluminis]|uniref:PXA domain-containing protein n=1 Tax=Knufia fluminis TaxID=191047 RepID=A0AAN8ESU7_9EURO|nr:hypothetical protein OHC33_004048 [Knufia fluminis]